MRYLIQRLFVTILLIVYGLFYASTTYASDIKDHTVKELTQTYHKAGWYALRFGYSKSNPNTIIIEQHNLKQKEPYAKDTLDMYFGGVLKPDTVEKLKKAGFTKGEFVDGKSRRYPFLISTEYYEERTRILQKALSQ